MSLCSRRQFQPAIQPRTGGQGYPHIQTELVPFAEHQVGDARLADAQRFGCFGCFGCFGLRLVAFFESQPQLHHHAARIARIATSSGGKPRTVNTLQLDRMVFSFMIQPPVSLSSHATVFLAWRGIRCSIANAQENTTLIRPLS
jgi:hypothetical protein